MDNRADNSKPNNETDEAVRLAEKSGFVRCDCGDEDGLPHCGWWFKDHKAYIQDDLVNRYRLSRCEQSNTVKASNQ